MKKRILFLTGTRADFGKLKPLINSVKNNEQFELKSKNCVHEFIHIVNKEKVYEKRVIWLDEGLATNLDNKNISSDDISFTLE